MSGTGDVGRRRWYVGEPSLARNLFRASYLGYAVACLYFWKTAPDVVATHFDARGRADAFNSRTSALVVWLAIGALVMLLFMALALAVPRLSWSLINLPAKEWWSATPERERRFRRMMAYDLWLFGAWTVLLLGILVVETAVASHRDPPHLGIGSWLVMITYVAAMIGYVTYQIRHRYRPDESSMGH